MKVLNRLLISQVAELPCIERVQHALFAPTHYQMRSGNQRCTGRVQVVVRLVQSKMVGREFAIPAWPTLTI
jgi:hypothetical protein